MALGGLAVPAAGQSGDAPKDGPQSAALPRRKLGRDGPEITVLCQGGSMSSHSPVHLEIAWAQGIRYFDASHRYLNGRCEENIARFITRIPERRKDLFLVTKQHPRSPEEFGSMVDDRLAALETDYIDLFFIHGIGPQRYGEQSLEWPKSDELRTVAEKMKSSGKVRRVGFSCHDARILDYMNAAAEGGFLDALMIAYDPFHEPGGDFDRALDACHEAGIGLVAMKNMRALGDASARIPALDELELTTHAAMVQAVLADQRISAACVEMANVDQVEENAAAARSWTEDSGRAAKELLQGHVGEVAHRTCPGCESCRAIVTETGSPLMDIARHVAYYECDGKQEAATLYRELPPSSRSIPSEVAARARTHCRYHVDYPAILARAERYFA